MFKVFFIRPLVDYIYFFISLVRKERLRHELSIAEARESDLKKCGGGEIYDCLDLGNGFLSPQFFIILSQGRRVTGVDLLNSNEFNFANMLRSFARKLFLYGLVSKVGNIDFNNGKLINANVEKLPLDNNSFDLISSVAAFEHFLSLDKVLAECDRVLRPGGHIWVAIHLYTAPSGAHNISFTQVPLTKMPRNVDPWDHLRKKKLPINIVLNKMRMADYEKVFAKYFDIKKQYCYLREGEQWYDEAVAKEIGSEYTEDELTCGTLVILAKSKK